MKRGRHSILTKLGRIFQLINPVLFSWTELLFKKNKIEKYPMIAIVSAPRSGSTLTTQILARGTKSLYLTNLWNLLYAMPLIGGFLSKNKTAKNDFQSNLGWVDGIYGESEGMRFWEYWIGQSLEEPIKKVPDLRINYIQKVFGRLLKNNNPMILSYLGHAFSVQELRKIFPGIIFIYLKRDKMANLNSLVNVNKDREWFSLKPIGWEKKKKLDSYKKSLWQYNQISSSLDNAYDKEDTLIVWYEDICNSPHEFLKKVQKFAYKNKIKLELDTSKVPAKFKSREIKRGDYMNNEKLLENE